MKQITRILFWTALCASAAMAQRWEVGAGVGGTFYTSQTISNPLGSASGTLSPGIAASAWLGNNSGHMLGGELRYDYENTNLKVSSGSTNATFGANTQAFHYDFLMHLAPQDLPVRPYVAVGGGVKFFRGTGPETEAQPLSNIALLTKTSDIKPVISVGAGVKFALGHSVQLRLEVHDYLSPFPTKVIAPALGSKAGGWLQDFVPMAALAFTL